MYNGITITRGLSLLSSTNLARVFFPGSAVKFLPGYEGVLPFQLETGYVGVGESDEVQLFYYFVSSEKNPEADPLLLWLTGGPCCSVFSALAYEIGRGVQWKPAKIDLESILMDKGGQHIIFVDSPVGTGFSYATSHLDSQAGDLEQVHQLHHSLRKITLNSSQVQSTLVGTCTLAFRLRHSSKRYAIPYTSNIPSSYEYHVNLSTQGYCALIYTYSGDHDMIVPFLGTKTWIKSLNYTIVDDWRPWMLQGQVAGYARTYSNRMTFATIKGGGHTAPEYRPAECQAMFERWISEEPL